MKTIYTLAATALMLYGGSHGKTDKDSDTTAEPVIDVSNVIIDSVTLYRNTPAHSLQTVPQTCTAGSTDMCRVRNIPPVTM